MWFWKRSVVSRLVYHPDYAHADGSTHAKTYRIAPGTTEIRFAFRDFDVVLQPFIGALPLDVREAHAGQGGGLYVHVADQGRYVIPLAFDERGAVRLRAAALLPIVGEPLKTFRSGVIAFGLYLPLAATFHVVWATMYTDRDA